MIFITYWRRRYQKYSEICINIIFTVFSNIIITLLKNWNKKLIWIIRSINLMLLDGNTYWRPIKSSCDKLLGQWLVVYCEFQLLSVTGGQLLAINYWRRIAGQEKATKKNVIAYFSKQVTPQDIIDA